MAYTYFNLFPPSPSVILDRLFRLCSQDRLFFLPMMMVNLLAMPSSALLIILSIVFGASNALPWPGPEPTAAYQGHEWSPRPTTIPRNPADIFKRDSVDVAVCGWIGGISSEPAICPPGSSCIHDLAHGYVGCCTTSGPCTAGVYTSCVDFHNPAWNSRPVWQNNGIYTW